eukprot:gene1291-biopygen9585
MFSTGAASSSRTPPVPSGRNSSNIVWLPVWRLVGTSIEDEPVTCHEAVTEKNAGAFGKAAPMTLSNAVRKPD